MEKAQILIVEDEEIVAVDLKIILERLGYTIPAVVASGEEALNKIEEFKPDLVLMDIVLQGDMDGIEAADRIHSRFNIPVVYASTFIDEKRIKAVKKTEAFGYILKPFEPRELQVVIEMALYKHGLEKRLRESEKKYRFLFEETPNINLIVGRDGMIKDVNRAVTEKFGYSKDKIIGKNPMEFVVPEQRQKVDEILRRVFAGDPTPEVEANVYAKDGSIHTLLFSPGEVVLYEGNQPVGVLFTGIDITERKHQEKELKESEERCLNLIESTHDMIQSLKPDGTFEFVNLAWRKTLGYSDKQIEHLKIFDIIHPESLSQCKKLFSRVTSGESVESIQATFLTKDGKKICVEGNAVPRYLDGKIIGIQGFLRDITDRMDAALASQQAEEALRQERDFAESLIETAQAIVLVLDKKGRIVRFNKYMEEISGYRLEEVKGKEWFTAFLPKRDRSNIRKLFQKAVADVQTCGNINPIVTKQGHEREIEWCDKTLKDRDGNILGLLTIGQDITERKRADKALRKSEEKYRLLVENANEIIAVVQDGVIKFVNPKVQEITGYSHDELIGKKFLKFVHPDDEEMVAQYFQNRMQSKKAPQTYNLRIIAKGGNIRWLVVNAVLISWEDKPATLAFLSDITESKHTEKALKESEYKFKSLYSMVRLMCDNVPDLIWAKDLKKRFIFTNKAICTKLLNAKDTGEPIGKTDMYFASRERKSHPDDPQYHTFGEICRDSDFVVMKSKKPERFDEFGNVKGKFLFLDVHKAPFWDEQGNMIGTVGCGRDVSKEKQLEEERKQVEEELIKSGEVLRNLFAHLQSVREEERTRISLEIHDELGQALTALKMDLYWLDNKLPPGPDRKSLRKKSQSMLKLLDKTIQTVKRISTDLRPGLLDDLGLVAAIEWQADEFQKHTGIECKLTVKPEDITIDQEMATAIFRIFQETLTNVARHAKATIVRTTLKEADNRIILEVKDNGIGITKEQIQDFKSLGLIGIRERVYPFKGNISIGGIAGKGTTVKVTIPLYK